MKLKQKFLDNKTIWLDEENEDVKQIFREKTESDAHGNINSQALKNVMNQFVAHLLKDPSKREIGVEYCKNEYGQKIVMFKKKIEGLAVGQKRPPINQMELIQEIKKWPRIGMKGSEKIQKSGFIRSYDFSHVYPDIDKDIDKLIEDGHLMEFKDFNNLHDSIKRDPAYQTRGERQPTLLYPVDIPNDLSQNKVEVRGTLGEQSFSKYPLESLKMMSQLFNDPDGPQKKIEDFKWEDIIEDKSTKLFEEMDEAEQNRYMFRKQTRNTFIPADYENQQNQAEKRGRGGGTRRQKNDHLDFDFLTNFN